MTQKRPEQLYLFYTEMYNNLFSIIWNSRQSNFHLFIHSFINPMHTSIYPTNHWSTFMCFYPTSHLLSIHHPSINPSIHQTIHPSMHFHPISHLPSLYPCISQSSIYLSSYSSIHPNTQASNCPSIQMCTSPFIHPSIHSCKIVQNRPTSLTFPEQMLHYKSPTL